MEGLLKILVWCLFVNLIMDFVCCWKYINVNVICEFKLKFIECYYVRDI